MPQLILPYTPMPENIKYDPMVEQLSDKWYHGSRTEQVDSLVDLLMNFDEYAKATDPIADLVPRAPKEAPPTEGKTSDATSGPPSSDAAVAVKSTHNETTRPKQRPRRNGYAATVEGFSMTKLNQLAAATLAGMLLLSGNIAVASGAI